jgi:hypothetical protein
MESIADVRHFCSHHFIGQWPTDTQTKQISRTVGDNHAVDEQ